MQVLVVSKYLEYSSWRVGSGGWTDDTDTEDSCVSNSSLRISPVYYSWDLIFIVMDIIPP